MEPITIGAYGTLVSASITLLIGHTLSRKVPFLHRFTIPSPVIGGLVVATLLLLIKSLYGAEFSFNEGLKEALMLSFFATIGLNANIASLRAGGKPLVIFLFVVTGLLIVQNSIGITLAKLIGLDPLLGLLSSSITLSGGHSTGGAWAEVFSREYGLTNATEVAMASATFGLVLGGLIGGPVAQLLLRHQKERPLTTHAPIEEVDVTAEREPTVPQLTAVTLLETIGLIALALFIGSSLAEHFGQIPINEERSLTIPPFVFILFVGAIINNTLHFTPKVNLSSSTVTLLGNVSLSLFLAMALMSLKLWELASLALPMFVILLAQTAAMALYALFITYPVMGRNHDAAVLAAGHCGFGLGATPTAVANMQAVTSRFGPSRMAFLIVPMVGAFFIDIANALVINLFLALPLY